MRMPCLIIVYLILIPVLRSQVTPDDGSLTTLLSGRKNPGDQEAIAKLGISSIDILMDRLAAEQDANKLPIYARLIGIKYRQFADQLTPSKKTEILTELCAKIQGIKDEGPSSYLIQSCLKNLEGINHPTVKQMTEVFLLSPVEWTKSAAESLNRSLVKMPENKESAVSEPPATRVSHERAQSPKSQVTEPTASTSSEGPASSTPWGLIGLLIAAALGLLVFLIKRRS